MTSRLKACLPLAALVAMCALAGGCGYAHADRVNALTREQLAHESDGSICHGWVNSPAAAAERQARGLGDCSVFAVRCKAMGYPATSPEHLRCRQTLAQEYAAHMAGGGPTVCNKVGNTMICNSGTTGDPRHRRP
jgi:hypothetical protein